MQVGRKLKFTQKYKQGKLLGQGVSGTVFRVEKIANEIIEESPPSSPSKSKNVQPRFFAAKHINLNTIDIQMAKKELKILQKLKHLSIVRVFEDFIENDELIIIMEYCEGKDLQYLIQDMKKKGKYFNENLVSTWIFQLILAIQYIHSKDIIHRDIKPQNIFVDQKMNIKIGDFGVSKLLDGTQNCKTTAGSPLYCSPEVMEGQSYSKKTDVWSLGCVIYQICTLQAPFSGKKGLLDLMVNIKNNEPKSIPKIYSADLNKLIRKMLLKDQKKRPSSNQLLQDSILVQLMINYSSSQTNLKQEYENKPIDKPSFSQSFIDAQSNAVVQRMKKFEEQVKLKIQSMKNKKVSTRQIDNYYLQIQSKMKALEKVVSTAFKELKSKQQANQISLDKSINKSQIPAKNEDQNSNTSRLSDSEATIKSVNLGSTLKKEKMQKSNTFQKKQTLDASSSIDSVNSIFVKSANKKNFQIREGSSLGLSSKTFQSVDLSSSSTNKKKMENVQQLDSTVKSEFLETIKTVNDPNKMKTQTIHHIDHISKEIANNPSLILDDTFLNVTLSLSNNDYDKFNMKKKNLTPQTSFDKSYSQSLNSINFELSKRGYDQSLSFSVSNKNPIEKKKQQSQKDSLEEQQYEPDFDEYEEDKQMDIREQQKKSVKDLFASTLKNLSLSKSDSNNPSEVNPRNKYSLTLSTIRQQSSEGGSTISFQED